MDASFCHSSNFGGPGGGGGGPGGGGGEPVVDGLPYCESCASLAYQKPTSRRRKLNEDELVKL